MSSTVRWSIGVLLLVFAVTGFALVSGKPMTAAEPAKKATGVEIVPTEGFAVLSINAARLHDAEVSKPIRDALEKGDKALLKRIEADYGVTLDQLDRVTFYWPAADYGDPTSTAVTFLSTRKPYDKAKFVKTWKGTAEPKNGGQFGFGGQFGQIGFPGGNLGAVGFAGGGLGAFGNGGVVIQPAIPGGGGQPPAKPGDDKPKELDLNAPFYYAGNYGETVIVPIDDTTLAVLPSGSYANGPAFVAALLRRKADGPLAEALALTGKHDVVFGVQGKQLREQVQMLRQGGLVQPPNVCGGLVDPVPPPPGGPQPGQPPEKVEDGYTPYEPLLELDRAVLTFDFGATTTLNVTAYYPTAEGAKKAEPLAKGAFKDLVDLLTADRKKLADDAAEKDWLPVYDFALAGLKGVKVSLDGKTLTATAAADVGADLKAAFVALPTKIQEAADRMKLQNNLRQIGLALHNYESANGFLPKDVKDEEGKVILSWRVELLPYLEANDLYTKIDRTKPWDDPVNKKLWDEMPDVFKTPSRATKEKHETYFQTFRTLNWLGKDDPWQVDNHNSTMTEVTDGTSHSLAVCEMEEAVNWMKPGDNLLDPKKLAKIGNPKSGKANAVMLDGSVRTLDTKKYTGDKLLAIITVNGGEEVDANDFK